MSDQNLVVLSSAPQNLRTTLLSLPASSILLVSINRPKQLNSLTIEASYELDSVFQWFDREPRLRVAVLTGVGRAFCVGADLKREFQNMVERLFRIQKLTNNTV